MLLRPLLKGTLRYTPALLRPLHFWGSGAKLGTGLACEQKPRGQSVVGKEG